MNPKAHTRDTIDRRLRLIAVSTGERIDLTERDIQWLQVIHDHGPQTTLSLHAFTSDDHRSLGATRRRLTQLFNEDNVCYEDMPLKGQVLARPFAQNEAFNARANYLVYDLSPAGLKILKKRGTYSDNRPTNRNPWKHGFMASAITTAIAIGCKERGFRYIPQHELLDRANQVLKTPVPYDWSVATRSGSRTERKTGVLVPDGLFAIDYGGKFRAFVIEADRGTEPIAPSDDQRKSLHKNILQYKTFIGSKLYKDAYGLNAGLVVLSVFNAEVRERAFKELIAQEFGQSSYLASLTAPEFASPFKPGGVSRHLFETPWNRVGHDPLNIMQA